MKHFISLTDFYNVKEKIGAISRRLFKIKTQTKNKKNNKQKQNKKQKKSKTKKLAITTDIHPWINMRKKYGIVFLIVL